MKNRLHHPKNIKTLRQICYEGNIPFPIEENYSIEVEAGVSELEEEIVRNFPSRSYSTRTTDPQKIVELLAYEAHEWQAFEILRSGKKNLLT